MRQPFCRLSTPVILLTWVLQEAELWGSLASDCPPLWDCLPEFHRRLSCEAAFLQTVHPCDIAYLSSTGGWVVRQPFCRLSTPVRLLTLVLQETELWGNLASDGPPLLDCLPEFYRRLSCEAALLQTDHPSKIAYLSSTGGWVVRQPFIQTVHPSKIAYLSSTGGWVVRQPFFRLNRVPLQVNRLILE